MQESNSGLDLGDSGKEGLCQRGGGKKIETKLKRQVFIKFHFQFNQFYTHKKRIVLHWLTVQTENRVFS